MLFLSSLAQLVQCSSFNLPNSLFRHTQLGANFFQSQRLVAVVQTEAANDNLLLALVKPRENPLDLPLTNVLRGFLTELIAAVVGLCGEHFVLARAEPVAMLELVRDRAGEVLHDRPTRVRAELVAAREIELLGRPDQRH